MAKLPGAVLGKTLAKQLGVDIGDCVQITSPTIGVMFGAQTRPPIAKQFRVIAMFEAGFDQYDSKLVYTDLYEAQVFYDQGDSVTGIEMKVDDIDHTHEVVEAIDSKLSNSVYHTMDWMDLNRGLFTALLIQQIGMSVVLALIIVVAAFTVIATLIMVVLDKKKEIAVLKAIGHERLRGAESVSLPGRRSSASSAPRSASSSAMSAARASLLTAFRSIPRSISSRSCPSSSARPSLPSRGSSRS